MDIVFLEGLLITMRIPQELATKTKATNKQYEFTYISITEIYREFRRIFDTLLNNHPELSLICGRGKVSPFRNYSLILQFAPTAGHKLQ
jgi:hypothetical protein